MKTSEKNTSYVLASALLKIIIALLLIAVFSVLFFIEPLVATVFAIVALSVVSVLATKKVRKRIKTERQIKKLCKREGYGFERNRSFLKSFSWNTHDHDFSITTESFRYYVHYLSPRSYRSSLTFEDKDSILYTEEPLKNIFTTVISIKPYKKTYKTDFPPLSDEGKKGCVRVILVSPVCGEMYEHDRDGGLAPTGSGMTKFGYTVMTGSGFVEAVKRTEEKTKI